MEIMISVSRAVTASATDMPLRAPRHPLWYVSIGTNRIQVLAIMPRFGASANKLQPDDVSRLTFSDDSDLILNVYEDEKV